jgi:hypothetical protein
MATATKPLGGDVGPLVSGGAALVAFSTPLNLVLLLICAGLLERLCGGYVADNSGPLLLLLGGAINVGLFLGLCGGALLAFRRSSARRRRVIVVAVLLLHLGLWLGWSFAVVAHMAATGEWL